MDERICNRRTCNNSLEGMRSHALYCCRNCKDLEGFYRRKDIVEANKLLEIIEKRFKKGKIITVQDGKIIKVEDDNH